MGVQLSAQGAIIKTAYEAEADTNAYNDAAVTKLAGIESAATADQTGAEIKTLYEAEANAYTDTKNTKLSGIEIAADVTDSTNVAAAGAVMDSDFSGGEGFMRKTGAGAYEVLKSNMAAAVAPTVNEDSGDGYVVGSRWLDTTADKEYVCLDATVGAAVWIETTGAGGGGVTDHGALTGLADDDHSQYLLVNGTRAMTSNLDIGVHYAFGYGFRGKSDSVFVTFAGGPGSADSSRVIIHGKDSTGNGRMSFAILDAAETGSVIAMQMEGGSDTPIVDINFGLDMNAKNIDDIGALILNDATELTIASGTVTVTQSYHTIDTESDAATDNLSAINGGTAGQELTIRAVNSAHTVVVQDGLVNLALEGNMTLDNAQDTISMIYDGTNWLEKSRSNNGA